MKSLRRKAEPSMRGAAPPGMLRHGLGTMKHGLVAAAVATTMAFGLPLLDAKAQPGSQPAAKTPAAKRATPARTATAKKLFTVKGTTTTITEGTQKRSVYVLAQNVKSLLEIQGPAKLTLKVYPVLRKALFATSASEHQLSIKCSSGPAGGTQKVSHYAGTTTMSTLKHADVPATHVIGIPVQFTAEVDKGAQQFSLISPQGFFEIVSVKPIVKKVKKPRPRPRPRIRFSPKPKPKKKAKPKKDPRMLFSLNGERLQFDGLGPSKASGDFYVNDLLGHIPVSDSISVLVGLYVTSYGQTLETPAAKTSLRSLSTDAMVGIGYGRGRHYLSALAFGGYRHLWTELSAADGRTVSDDVRQAEYGASLYYAYDRYFSMLLSGSNNQFNPLTAKLRGALHKGLPWVKGYNPSLEVTVSWIRAAVSAEEDGMIGGLELSHDAVDLLPIADIPVLRFKMLVLSILAGSEMTISHSGDFWATGFFGAGLTFDYKGFTMQLRGLGSIDGQPYVTLNLVYTR